MWEWVCMLGQNNSSIPTTFCVIFYGHIPWDVMFKYFQCFWIYFIAVRILYCCCCCFLFLIPISHSIQSFFVHPSPTTMVYNHKLTFYAFKTQSIHALWLALVCSWRGSVVVILVLFERFHRLWVRHEPHVEKDFRHH